MRSLNGIRYQRGVSAEPANDWSALTVALTDLQVVVFAIRSRRLYIELQEVKRDLRPDGLGDDEDALPVWGVGIGIERWRDDARGGWEFAATN